MSKASRSPERRAERVCRKKKKYKTVFEAGVMAAHYAVNHNKKFDVYECGDHYHLTTKCVDLDTGQYEETFS